MSNDWNAFRKKLEEEGVLFVDEDTHVLPRVREKIRDGGGIFAES